MISNKELEKALEEDSIRNEDLAECLENHSYRIVVMAMFKAIERNYCDHRIIDRLSEFSKRLENNKFLGPWQIGHVAIATLALIDDRQANEKFNEINESLNENDRFLVRNFIESETYKD